MTRRPLTGQQMLAVKVSERIMSVLSIIGSLFIIGTFIRWHYFRKPINRLVFYASFGNVMANVATLISTSALPEPHEAPSSLCKFQATIIQWFLMADSLWVFCMALNVMLVFFFQYNSRRLRRLEKWYLLFSYGVPFIPAFIYIVVERATHRRIFGGATIWCWVAAEVEWMRIAFFYGPVWVAVCCTMCIYIVTGHKIFKKRKTLRSFSRKRASNPPVIANPFTAANLNGIERRTEISIKYTTDTVDSESTVVTPSYEDESRSSFSSTQNLSDNVQPSTTTAPSALPPSRFNPMKWTHPVHEERQGEDPGSRYTAAVSAHKTIEPVETALPRSRHNNSNVRRTPAMEGNSAAWSYFKVAFLMFAALFIVWVPSTINRLQQFINKDKPIFGLNLASALVLPLQGFWNSMVYISTTWPECKRAITEVLDAIAAAKGRTLLPEHQRKDSEHTLTEPEPEFEAEIPLGEILEQDAPIPALHSNTSSTDSIRKPTQYHSKV